MINSTTLTFLRQLKKNNNKAWFDAHRKEYEAAKLNFEQFIQQVIDQHSKKDPSLSGMAAKSCMFRLNRDVRFSKDKSPYKTNFGAFINKGGKKSPLAGYYFHLEPGGAFCGGGMYMPEPPMLAKIRQEVDYNLPAFRKIIGSAAFKKLYGGLSTSEEYSLTRVPKGYEADNPAAEYLKLKSFVALQQLDDKNLTSKDLLKNTLAAFVALQPLVVFLNTAAEE